MIPKRAASADAIQWTIGFELERQVPTPERVIKLRPDLVDVSQWEGVALDYKSRLMAANAPLEKEELAAAESPEQVLPNLESMVRGRTKSIAQASAKTDPKLDQFEKLDQPEKVECPKLAVGAVIKFIPSGETEATWGKVNMVVGPKYLVYRARLESDATRGSFEEGAAFLNPETDTFQAQLS